MHDPLYHVTFSRSLEGIAEDGLRPGTGHNFAGYQGYAKGWLHLCDADALSGWFHKLLYSGQDTDDPVSDGVVLVVLRLTEDAESDLDIDVDELGNEAVPNGTSYRTTDTVPPDGLEVWDGTEWLPIWQWESVNVEEGVRMETDDGEEYAVTLDSEESPLFPPVDEL